uniref:Putative secreted peptide n=1 Tax=Anopheles braziliensis TaxID=58242 RepID=A0A2M3ZV79_9DIPT
MAKACVTAAAAAAASPILSLLVSHGCNLQHTAHNNPQWQQVETARRVMLDNATHNIITDRQADTFRQAYTQPSSWFAT